MIARIPDARGGPAETGPLPDPDALLHDTDWAACLHALGPAEDTPAALIQLLDEDTAVRAKALRHLEQTVHHQNTIYSSTVPVALYVAAILADPRTATAGVYRRHDMRWANVCRPLRAVLLDWLGEIALDVGDHSVSIMERAGFPLAEYPEMVELRARRPAIFHAVQAFLNDPDPAVRDAGVVAAALLVDSDPELIGHRALLAPALSALVNSGEPIYSVCAVDRLTAWGEPTPPNAAWGEPASHYAAWPSGQDTDPPF
jgi:hypothetical protein